MLNKELMQTLHGLNRADKLRVVQLLVNELAAEEAIISPGVTYEVWSPFNSPDAAESLLQLLEEDKKQRNA